MSQLRNQGEVSKTFILKRNPLYGLGFAISGGKDNPAVLSGDTSLIISDVIKGGPAWNRLQVSLRATEPLSGCQCPISNKNQAKLSEYNILQGQR